MKTMEWEQGTEQVGPWRPLYGLLPHNTELVLLYEEEGGYIIKVLASTLSTVVNFCRVLSTGGA